MNTIFKVIVSILLINIAIVNCLPPNNVKVFGSSGCGNCSFFYARQLGPMIKTAEYEALAEISIWPAIFLTEKKNSDGTYTIQHKQGPFYVAKAKSQFCVNRLYSKDTAIKWAIDSGYVKNQNDLIKLVANSVLFASDKGAAMLKCLNGSDGSLYAHDAIALWKKYACGGGFPFIFVDEKRSSYNQFNAEKQSFHKFLCSTRNDASNLKSCLNAKESELKFLESEQIEEETEKIDDPSKPFDYEKFWESNDD